TGFRPPDHGRRPALRTDDVRPAAGGYIRPASQAHRGGGLKHGRERTGTDRTTYQQAPRGGAEKRSNPPLDRAERRGWDSHSRRRPAVSRRLHGRPAARIDEREPHADPRTGTR